MATSARIRKRQYENAVKRETYQNRIDRPVKETVSKRPRTPFLYRSYSIKSGAPIASEVFGVQVTERSLDFFGGGPALGLQSTVSYTDPIVKIPRFFTPAKLNAGVGLVAPTAKRSAWGTRVVKSKSGSFSAAISGTDVDVLYDEIDARARTIRTAIQGKLGDLSYASLYLSPEIFNNQKL